MIKSVGIVVLAVGFVALAIAVLIRDPTAADANIGAGILSLVGIPVGGLGLVMIVVGRLLDRRPRQDRSSTV